MNCLTESSFESITPATRFFVFLALMLLSAPGLTAQWSDLGRPMENHDAKYIPPIYLSIWSSLLHNPKAQRPIAMNLFQHFEQAGNTDKASYWLDVFRQQRTGLTTDPAADATTENISAD